MLERSLRHSYRGNAGQQQRDKLPDHARIRSTLAGTGIAKGGDRLVRLWARSMVLRWRFAFFAIQLLRLADKLSLPCSMMQLRFDHDRWSICQLSHVKTCVKSAFALDCVPRGSEGAIATASFRPSNHTRKEARSAPGKRWRFSQV